MFALGKKKSTAHTTQGPTQEAQTQTKEGLVRITTEIEDVGMRRAWEGHCSMATTAQRGATGKRSPGPEA